MMERQEDNAAEMVVLQEFNGGDNEKLLAACLTSWRKKGLGERICDYAIKVAERRKDGVLLVAQAQTHSLCFYEKLGFIAVSDTFIEAGIPHQTMIYLPPKNVKLELDAWNDSIARYPFVAGECFDPNVISVIRKLIHLKWEKCYPRLVHLRFETEERVVGSSLLRTYRECALATQRSDFERSEKLEKLLLTLTWEKLNTGHYSQVNDAWRALYSAVAACKAYRLLAHHKFEEAIRACDMGLMMGGDVDGQSLSAFATYIHSLCPPLAPLLVKVSSSDEPKPLSNSCWIRRIERPSMDEFCGFIRRGEPVIITGVVSQWPAFEVCSFEYFNSVMGHRTVPVEVGSSYASDGWSQSLMTVTEFMQQFIENESERGVGYLAQHRLFDQVPELLDDIIVPDYCAFGEESLDQVDLNIWVGPAGTVSPLHTDPKSNIFCQVYGRKFLRLVPNSDTAVVYPNDEGFLTNTSQVDAEQPDLSRYPLFKSAHVLDCVLLAGECLFIPTAFWHYVKALQPSISVSCWFHTQNASSL
ncbi:Lysine-specific demethylase 8 [Toxocara canis]|uniref:Lysine-specific demethylase 8 n=1 Tax=Toxocara canis TaxID=6265 RepID=A0A0B2V973_TOXCA|nr:Lysine-specific demethylase 8 [Toxocara canis]